MASRPTAFSGFPPDTLEFLAELRANNTKDFFDDNRARYDEAIEAAKLFVVRSGEVLAKIAPEAEADPRINGSIFRINRDIRFSKDKTPYKEHLDFWFWQGERREAVSGFFARVNPEEFGVGAGAYSFDSARLARFRAAVADPATGKELAAIAKKLAKVGLHLGTEHYKRTPKGFDESGPASEFLRHNSLHAYAAHDPDVALDATAAMAACRTTWRRLAPLHQWLVDNVA